MRRRLDGRRVSRELHYGEEAYLASWLMKIPRRRQDANVARVTDFLSGRVEVIAAVVIERLDQRGPDRQSMFAGERVIGETGQIVGAVREPLRDQMGDFFRTALDITLGQDEARTHHLLAV